MIEIGSTEITAITIGTSAVEKIDWGTDQVWPVNVPSYITISPTEASISENYNTGTIQVDTNVETWQVYESLDWVTTSKSSTGVSWTATTNNSSGRSGDICISGGGVQQIFQLSQQGGYYIAIDGGNTPINVGSGSGFITISVISTYHDSPLAVTSSVTANWITFVSLSQVGNKYNYRYSYTQNTDSQSRYAIFTFTQTAGSNSTAIRLNQEGRYVPEPISGFTAFTNYGDWQIGRYQNGTTIGPGGQTYPIYAIAILNSVIQTVSTTLNYTVNYSYGMPSPTTTGSVSGPSTVTPSSTVTIPGGQTAYGVVITSAPQAYITSVSNFSAT